MVKNMVLVLVYPEKQTTVNYFFFRLKILASVMMAGNHFAYDRLLIMYFQTF